MSLKIPHNAFVFVGVGRKALLTNRPSLDLSPIVLKGLENLSGSEGQIRCLPQPEQLHGAWTEQGTAEGRRQLIAWLRKHKVGQAVMEASGGYERDWAR